jgi:hypothetical protein
VLTQRGAEEVTGSIPVSPTMPKGHLTCGLGGLLVFFGASRPRRPADLVASFVANRGEWLRLVDRVVEEEVAVSSRGELGQAPDVDEETVRGLLVRLHEPVLVPHHDH